MLASSCLAGVRYTYFEDRHHEPGYARLRDDQPGSDLSTWLAGRGLHTSEGSPLLAHPAVSVRDLTLVPGGRAAVLLVAHRPPLPQLDGLTASESPTVGHRGSFRLLDTRATSICGFDVSPDGRRVAAVEWTKTGALSLFDTTTGERDFLTRLPNIMGGEAPSWSPDGRHILVPSNLPVVVSLDDRRIVDLRLDREYLQVDWWPSRGPASLFALAGIAEQRAYHLDLSSGATELLGTVRQETQADLDPDHHLLAKPKMSPLGDTVLVGSAVGPSAAFQARFGSRHRVATLDVASLEVTGRASPWCDPEGWVLREHSRLRWTGRPTSAGPLTIAGRLLAASAPFATADPAIDGWDPIDRRASLVVWSW